MMDYSKSEIEHMAALAVYARVALMQQKDNGEDSVLVLRRSLVEGHLAALDGATTAYLNSLDPNYI